MGDWFRSGWGGALKAATTLVFIEKNKSLLDKTERAASARYVLRSAVGRFVGPTRAMVPMVAGMLDLQWRRNLLGRTVGV